MIYPIPWSVQIEPTRNCNRRCHMCGIHSTNWKIGEYDFMSPELAKAIATDINSWIPQGRRIEAALQGEPLINPSIVEIIYNFRQYYPKCQLQITTNGDFITRELVENLFKNGLNMLLIDCYGENTKERSQRILEGISVKQLDFHKDKPKVWAYKGFKQQEIIYMYDLLDKNKKSVNRKLNNQAGFSWKLDKPLKLHCSNPFNELVIKHSGIVTFCCMQWIVKEPMGKFPEQSLQQIWEGEKFNNIRQILFNKERYKNELCSVCSYSGYKNGLAIKRWNNILTKTIPEIPVKKSRSLFE